MNKEKPLVVVVVGPTASGKTSLGIDIAKALDGEIISADSMQIYKRLDVGTAKATKEEQESVKHHLIDICNIEDKFSVADYKSKCYAKIEELLMQGKTPVIVGGTGLYINAVVNNMNFEEKCESKEYVENKELARKELEDILAKKGKEYLYQMLIDLDKNAAENIHMNNTKRVIRAIELAREGNAKSDIEKRNDLWNKNESKYNFVTVYIDMPREVLYDRINKRVDIMESLGVIEEAKMLKEMDLDKNSTAIQAIGYKEFFEYIDGKESLNEALEKLKQNTRRYAKRQITWFNKLNCDIILNENTSQDEVIEKLKRIKYEK